MVLINFQFCELCLRKIIYFDILHFLSCVDTIDFWAFCRSDNQSDLSNYLCIHPWIYLDTSKWYTPWWVRSKGQECHYAYTRSNHVHAVWQHLVLLVLRQYECKSYRRFIDFLDECVGVKQFLRLHKIHTPTLQKPATRLTHGILLRIWNRLSCTTRYANVCSNRFQGLSHGKASHTTQNDTNYEGNSSRYWFMMIWNPDHL